MSMILSLLKQLASSLSPTDFLLVLVIIAATSFYAVNFFRKLYNSKSSGSLFGGSTTENEKMQKDVAKIERDISTIISNQTELFSKLASMIETVKELLDENTEIVREHTTQMLIFKKDVESHTQAIRKEIDSIVHQLKMQDLHSSQTSESMKESLAKIHTSTAHLISQLEKTDEFAKAFVPEFRSYHKELGKDITDLSKDVALMERSVQTSINNHNSLKLR